MRRVPDVREKQVLLVLFLIGMALHLMKTSAALSSEVDTKRCVEKERQALLDFLPAGNLRSSLLHDHDCCHWHGVYCSNVTGRIVRLDLDDLFSDSCPVLDRQINLSPLLGLKHLFSLNLDIPCDWLPFPLFLDFSGCFRKLRYLRLSPSLFNGTIPPQLYNHTRLQSLEIFEYYVPSSDSLSCTKSLKWLSRLTSLKRLVLRDLNLSDATDWIHAVNNLPSLKYLDLGDSFLPNFVPSPVLGPNVSKSLAFVDLSNTLLKASSIWTWLFNHSSLVELYLSWNQLEGPIPSGFRSMTSLAHLSLSSNQLEGEFSHSIQGLCSLYSMDLSRNKLSEDVASIFQSLSCSAKSLTYLSLPHNRLTGSLPDVNQLDGSLPSGPSKPWSLIILNLQHNKLTGPVPDVSAFRSLKLLNLRNNKLNGTVHVSLGQLSSLEKLSISSNSLKGQIFADHFSNLSNLRYLDMSFNSLTFNVSSNWAPPFRLATIRLASCRLGPHFPEWLQTQRNYTWLDMSDAGISDTFPPWFWNLSSLARFIDLSRNELHGTLPNSSIEFSEQLHINLGSNKLEGATPFYLSNVSFLNLSTNSFSGPISSLCPRTINGRSRLAFLDLSHNMLSGEFPSCLMELHTILLDLSNNNFYGNLSIPNVPGSLASLHLENNRFSGELPKLLGNYTDLIYLDLGGNLFSGKIPIWIGDMLPNLVSLNLRNNSFSGSIPQQLCHLSLLQILDLSLNNLSEGIPNCLCNLTAMTNKESGLPYVNAFLDFDPFYKDHVSIELKGFMYEFQKHLELIKSFDLSSNKFGGAIPDEISCLIGVISLNLSRNDLNGSITSGIGKLTSLESLDLSQNHLSGEIPTSISSLSFLGTLNLSSNNLSGRIPMGTQIQGLEASVFEGNPGLCGEPLPKKCPGEGRSKGVEGGGNSDGSKGEGDGQKDEDWGLYISIILGFITGFWGVCGALVIKRSWRHAYFRFWIRIYDKLYVIIALTVARR